MKNPDNHKISRVLVRLDRRFVGVTGFEPATTRPPAECATGLRYTPKITKIKLRQLKAKLTRNCFNSSDTGRSLSRASSRGYTPNLDCKNIKVE